MFVLALRALFAPSYRFPHVNMIGIAHYGFVQAQVIHEWIKDEIQRFARETPTLGKTAPYQPVLIQTNFWGAATRNGDFEAFRIRSHADL